MSYGQVDKSLLREIKRAVGSTRDEQRAFRRRVGRMAEELSSTDVAEKFDGLAVFDARVPVAVALAATLANRAWRIGKWNLGWAQEVLDACKALPKGSLDGFVVQDGLHPLRITEYARKFIALNSEYGG